MNTFKKLSSIVMMLALVLCVSVSFASCDLINSIIGHECADADNNHLCDTCEKALSECADADKNHNCDVCGKALTNCADANSDHKCDTCGATVSSCADNNPKDHKCDVCGAELSECYVDDNFDHLCDGCGMVLGECYDGDKDHDCDYCGAVMGGECADGDDEGHNCDYCGANLCADGEDADHNCDVCGASLCVDADEDCACDVCEGPLHVDANLDHKCDKCEGVSGEHADTDADTDHDCDYCYKSVCADGDDADHNCDVCGESLCADANGDHKCDTCEAKVCYDGSDRGHTCDVCGESLCADADGDHKCDSCGELVCSNCETHTAPVVSVYVEGANCSVNGSNVVKFYSLDEVVAVAPSYTATAFVIDFWAVYDATNTPVAYIDNGESWTPTAAGSYYVAPVFVANTLDGVTDADYNINVNDRYETVLGTDNAIENELVSDEVLTPEWANKPINDKMVVVTGNALGSTNNAQLYLTTEPGNAANAVLIFANATDKWGSSGNAIMSFGIDAESKGDNYTIQFDYYLDYANCINDPGIEFFVEDDAKEKFFIGRINLPKKANLPEHTTANPSTPIAEKATLISRNPDNKATGCQKVLIATDTWYTIKLVIEYNKVNLYYSLRGADEMILIDTQDFSAREISAKNLTTFGYQIGYYTHDAISMYDNIWFGRGHECADADNNHLCDTCEKALCYDRNDADHNCDRCGASMCYEGDVADHYCDECGAKLSECVENVIDHYCDICGKWQYGGDAHVDGEDEGHDCDYCSANMCVDADKDHVCDVESCKAPMGGECADTNKDHNCDYCGERKFGSVEGSTECADANTDHKCDWCGTEMNMDKHVDADAADTTYKFAMVQGNLDNAVYYLAGGMDGYYMATTTDASAAIDVYLEKTEGGYYLYTLSGESKLYINMVVDGTHVNGAYEATASTVYTYDAEKKTIIAVVNDTNYWFGTRNDKTFTTVGPVKVEYNGFYCQFYAESEGGDDASATPTYSVVDTPKAFDNDHVCDYGCGATISKCVDVNTDYKCDECGKDLCYDLDNDHICDIEAHKATGEKISECVDENKDHICDFAGCKKVLSQCAEGENEDHLCDYCGKYNSAWCADTNNNHLCDLEACGKALSECADANADHKCDKCGADVCTDANADRFCDNCKNYIPYNFESTKIESNGDLAFSNVNYKNKEDYVTSTSVELNGTRTEGYNASTHLYLEADPDNAANVLLAAQSASGSGLTEDTISDIKFTPTALVEGGDLVVLEFDYNLYKSGANAKNTFRWAYHYASGDVKRANGTYTTNSNASVRLVADKDGSMKFDIGSWVRIRLVCDNTNKKIYTYLSTDNGATYTLQETVDAYAYDSTIASVDITFVGWGVSATQYFDNVKCVITTAEAYGISFE